MASQSLDLGSDGSLPVRDSVTQGAVGNSTAAGLREAADSLFVNFLDDVHFRLSNRHHEEGVVSHALDELFLALRARRLASSPKEWHEFVQMCRRHPVIKVLHRDPFTFRAFSKPRGYAGDARMMDFIYGAEERRPVPTEDPLGQSIFRYTTSAPASLGVCDRRAFIARAIDRLAERRHRPRVLSIAAGHLREVQLSAAARRNRLGKFVALDADARSLEEIERCYGPFGVGTVHSTFRGLISGKIRLDPVDLVYSTGLFDYLEERPARRLVTTMHRLLRPGGRLIVANFLPGVRDVGYMETFMDWNLVYRTRQEMIELTAEIPESEIRRLTLFTEEGKNIIFLTVRKQ